MTQLEQIRKEQIKKVKARDVMQVQVRNDLVVGEHYDGLTWLDYMQHGAEVRKHVLKVVDILVEKDGRKVYVVTFINSQIHWYLTEKMIVQVIEVENEWN